jgi:hypothetical protein
MCEILRELGVELRFGLTDEADAVYKTEAATELGFGDEDSDNEELPAR